MNEYYRASHSQPCRIDWATFSNTDPNAVSALWPPPRETISIVKTFARNLSNVSPGPTEPESSAVQHFGDETKSRGSVIKGNGIVRLYKLKHKAQTQLRDLRKALRLCVMVKVKHAEISSRFAVYEGSSNTSSSIRAS